MQQQVRQKISSALRWSEKYTKTDMVYLTKGMSWLTLGQFSSAGVAFILSIAFANLLEPETYGSYRYVLSIFNILVIPTLIGINTSLQKAVSNGLDASIYDALKTRLRWSTLGLVAGILISLYYLFNNNYTLALSFLIISTVLPFFYSFEVYGSFLNGKKLFKISSIFTTITVFVSTIPLIISLFFTQNIFILLTVYLIPITLARGTFLLITLKKYVTNTSSDPQMVPYGKKISLLSAIDKIASNMDQFILWHLLGPAQLAIYAFAVAPINQIASFKGNLKQIVFPKIATTKISRLKEVVYPKVLRLLTVATVVCITYIIVAPYLYKLLFPQYIESVIYSQVFALSVLAYPFFIFMKTTFIAHAKVRQQYYINMIYSVSKIILYITLVPLIGIWGIIVGYLIAQLLNVLTQIFLFSKL